jgi:serine O-acetyltransferase
MTDVSTTTHNGPLPDGTENRNPNGIGLIELIIEDFQTHDSSVAEPGFWTVALHRLGNARMAVEPRWLRAPLSASYKVAFVLTDWMFGIELPYTVKLGRRVRIWHHGGIVINARSIGDDVHIRHNTTLGVARRDALEQLPIIGDRVDIGAGACILGAVTVGDDALIGANSVVLHDVPRGATAVGAPARILMKGQQLARSSSGMRFRAVTLSGVPSDRRTPPTRLREST